MKATLVVLAMAMFASVHAEAGYGAPAIVSSGYAAPAPSEYGAPAPQVHRHVYVHVGPDDIDQSESKVIRVPGGDKHVNIIFVKTPSQSSSQQTEVILPEQDTHKNLVYVLLKKGESNSNIRVRGPAPRAPAKPEVYFIRYQNKQGQTEYGPPPSTPVQSYGAP